MIKIYTDGSASKKSCGYGMVALEDGELKFFHSDYCQDSTNNREEMKAILDAYNYIDALPSDSDCTIYSDSAYCVNMMNNWIDKWRILNWHKYDGKELKNLDLVKQLYEYKLSHPTVTICKVSGHTGDYGNEFADALATNNKAKQKKYFDKIKNF